MKKKAGIIGATGYAGVELVRILLNHPYVEVAAISSVSYEGKKLSEVYPSLKNICDLTLTDENEVIEKSDIVLASLPHGLSHEIAKKCDEKGKLFIDLGADFRLTDEADYQEWYGLDYKYPELSRKAVYGLCELYKDRIEKATIVGNPGCYPTSIALGMMPALRYAMVETKGIVIDSKSGVTGSGRGLSQTTHFPDCNEAFSPYKVAVHRHTPEIEQTLSDVAGTPLKVTFVPHLLPLNRGIVSTIYADLKPGWTLEEIHRKYCEAYAEKKFVRVLELGETANLKNVRCSNYCDISLHVDRRCNKLIVVSTIDNMVKGAAGQAVQNINILYGFPEDTGLNLIPPAM